MGNKEESEQNAEKSHNSMRLDYEVISIRSKKADWNV
jgi:hypothetical protein